METNTNYISTEINECSPSELHRHISSAFCQKTVNTYESIPTGSLEPNKGYVRFIDKLFYDSAYANRWLEKNTHNKSNLTAVKVLNTNNICTKRFDKEEVSIRNKLVMLETELGIRSREHLKRADFIESIALKALNRVKNGKNKFKICPNCQSKIAVIHIKTQNCPVCDKDRFLFRGTDLTKESVLSNKHKSLSMRLLEIHRSKYLYIKSVLANQKVESFVWLVGGWFINRNL